VLATEKVAAWPWVTVWESGCEVMEGATTAAVTDRVAGALAMLPALLLTMALNCAELSPTTVAEIV